MKEATYRISEIVIPVILLFCLLFIAGHTKSQSVTAGFNYSSDCLDFVFENTSISTGGNIIAYYWDFGDGAGTSTAENPVYSYDAASIYTVTLTVTHESMITDDFSQIVNASFASANFSYSQDCELFQFTNNSFPGDLDSVYWHFGEGDTVKLNNPPFGYNYNFSASGNYPVNLKVFKDGCSDEKTTTISFTDPVPEFIYNQIVDTFYFQDLSTPVGEITSWLWDFGDGNSSTLQNPSHYYTVADNYTVILEITTSQGCTKIKSRPVVFYLPVADFTYTSNCETFKFEDLSSPSDSIVSWFWDFGDGFGTSSSQNPTYSYSLDGFYKVILEVQLESGSSDTTSQWINYHHPDAQFSHDPACTGSQTCFYDESLPGGENSITSWNWNFGNGSSSSLQNPCYIYGVSGTYYVTLTVENSMGCVTTSENDTLFIDAPPVVDFFSNDVCFNEITLFTNLTDTSNIPISNWQWNFGDPGSGANNTSSLFEPDHLYTAEGTFQVTLSVENIFGCITNKLKTVTIDSIPSALYSLPEDTIAVGTLFEITDNSIAHGTPILLRFWDFGDGITSTNPNPVQHTYDEPGIYEICLTVTNLKGCTDTLCQTIVVTALPYVDFDYILNPDLEVDFFDNSYSESEIVNWRWDFGDPTVTTDTISGDPSPNYLYPSEGFYPVFLEITDSYNGKRDTTKTIYVGKAIHSEFIQENACSGDTVKFFDESFSLVSAQFLSWYWDFGDNTYLQYYQKKDSVLHFYESAGLFDVTLITTGLLNGYIVRDTIVKQVKVFNLPVAQIDAENLVACLGQPIQFIDSSYSIDGDVISSWLWDFGDGQTSTLQSPSHTYDSIKEYEVVLTINTENYCTNIDVKTAKITIAPDVDFVVKNACVNSPAYFIHTESDIEITDWFWNFNDPYKPGLDTSTLETPSYVYSQINVYHVTMEASSYGCTKKVQKSFLVYPIPFSEFTYTPNYQGVQGRTMFSNSSIYATNYLWDFGNGHTSNVEDPIEVYEYDSTYTITLISFNEYGCSDTNRQELKVFFRGLYFPTAFSPNNPNYEVSRFMPKGINLAEYLVQVFDLRGNLIWESDKLDEYGSPLESWDGYYNGILMPEGVYVWKANGVFRDGSTWKGSDLQYDNPKTNGTVTLIR